MKNNNIKANILDDIKINLDDFNPYAIAKHIAYQLKKRRLELNITQKKLSELSGVSMGSVKRFENTAEISLKHLLMIAIVLQSTEEFYLLFSKQQYNSLSEIIQDKKSKTRYRARKGK